MDRLLSRGPERDINMRDYTGTLFDRYANQVPIYKKFLNFDKRYFATAVIDLKGVNRKAKMIQTVSEPATNR